MTYTVGIPFDGQSLSNSKPQIRSNFTVINTAFSVNHLALGAVDQGKHKFLQMPQQGSAPSTALNEGGLYAKDVSGITSLFWRQENNGAEVRLTGVTPVALENGYSTLPGGLIIQWGADTNDMTEGENRTYTFPIAFPSTCATVQVTIFGNGDASGDNGPVALFSKSRTEFATESLSQATVPGITWLAIGW